MNLKLSPTQGSVHQRHIVERFRRKANILRRQQFMIMEKQDRILICEHDLEPDYCNMLDL